MSAFDIRIRRGFVPVIYAIAGLLFFCVPALPQDCSPPDIVFNKNACNIFSFEHENCPGEVTRRFLAELAA